MNKHGFIYIDFSDLDAMLEVMQKYGGHHDWDCLTGCNADGETTLTHIYPDHISVNTYQNNGWVRTNTLYDDGTQEESYSK